MTATPSRDENLSRQDKTRPVGAMLLMMGGVSIFALNDALTRILADAVGVPLAVWSRYVFCLVAILAVTGPSRWLDLFHTARPGVQVLRALLPLTGSVLFIIALGHIGLAEATAIFFTAPLLVTALSRLVLNEEVSPRRWLVVAAGFLGVLIVVRPNSEVFQPMSLLPLGTALVFACYQILTRLTHSGARPISSLTYLAVMGVVVMTASLPFTEAALPELSLWPLMVLAGLLYGLSHFMVTKALTKAEASSLSPFINAQMISAVFCGYLFFNQIPDMLTLIGGAIIIMAGLASARR
ncbi:DMT family transporter [Telmatospirillum sp. J64-1]|uniref:DMT family transporter n=1 Tax=Telmatospirillum sp. J64-1 TaxID=2502183 RepID=UPI00163DC54D|nr:DMT family transporter [Telmatospirillum sp. J64-1]